MDSLKTTGKLSKKEWIELSKNYDIFINTTNFDNHPISVLEGMALGLPVVSTSVGGIPFLIENKVDGILIPPNDAGQFFEAIDNLIKDNDLVLRITKNARNKVEEFDWEILKYKWFDTIDNVLKVNKNNIS